MSDVVIVSAARTPVGSFNGVFGAVPAHLLGITALKAAIERAGLSPEDIDEVILGHQPALRLRFAGSRFGGAADPYR
jgi:acetyl-CoA C-acetyltransferase